MFFIKAHITNKSIVLDDLDEGEINLNLEDVIDDVINGTNLSKCYLFLPSDMQSFGQAIDRNVSREKYLKDPAKYGIAIYKGAKGTIIIE